MSTAMKCDVVKSLVLPQEEWDLLDQLVDQGAAPSRNELIRRCVHHSVNSMLVAGLHPANVSLILKEARGQLLTPSRLVPLLAGR